MNRINQFILSIIIATAFPFGQTFAASSDLISLYLHALDYDTDIAAAESAYMAEQQGEDIARSSLLPSLNASASYAQTNSNTQIGFDDSFQTQGYSVSLSQSLINLPNWHGFSASKLNTMRAQSVYLSAKQNLILDVASAYFRVLREKENLKTARSQEAAVKRQYEQAREQFDVGLIAITDVHEANASYDSSKTNRIRSEGNLTVAIENLSRLTGQYTSELHTLKKDFPIQLDQAFNAEDWEKAAHENNLSIKTAEFALKSLQAQLKASKAQHLPLLDLGLSYGNTDLSNLRTGDNENEESTVSLTLNLPLYSGGATQAGIRQSRHQTEQAKHLSTSAQRLARIEARTEYINIKTNIQTVESLNQNIISRESALEATREGYNVGTRNIVEVLDAERNYFTALRDYANARFDFVESSLRIRRAAGTLSAADLKTLNTWLEPES